MEGTPLKITSLSIIQSGALRIKIFMEPGTGALLAPSLRLSLGEKASKTCCWKEVCMMFSVNLVLRDQGLIGEIFSARENQ